MPVKVIWDYTYYWGVLCQLFFQRRLTDLTSMARLREELMFTMALNDALRAVMIDGRGLAGIPFELAVLAAWGAVSFAVALKIFRWK